MMSFTGWHRVAPKGHVGENRYSLYLRLASTGLWCGGPVQPHFRACLWPRTAEASCLVASRHADMRSVIEPCGEGSLKIVKLSAKPYEKANFKTRILWTLKTNTRIVIGLWSELWSCDEIRLHWQSTFVFTLDRAAQPSVAQASRVPNHRFPSGMFDRSTRSPVLVARSGLSFDAVLAAPSDSFRSAGRRPKGAIDRKRNQRRAN